MYESLVNGPFREGWIIIVFLSQKVVEGTINSVFADVITTPPMQYKRAIWDCSPLGISTYFVHLMVLMLTLDNATIPTIKD